MSSQNIKEIILNAISQRPKSNFNYYHICWWDKQIQCLPPHHTEEKHNIFFGAGGDTFDNGLSSYQLKLIEERIMVFWRDRKITLPAKSKTKKTDGGKNKRKQKIQITEFDSKRLKTLLITANKPGCSTEKQLNQLQQLLEDTEIVTPENIPSDTVTMNSKVRLKDYRSNKDMVLSVVFPSDADVGKDRDNLKISILAPIGLLVFGRRVGEKASANIKIEELLYQPEAAGDFHL